MFILAKFCKFPLYKLKNEKNINELNEKLLLYSKIIKNRAELSVVKSKTR